MSSRNPPTSKVSDSEITAFLKSNPGMSDSKIRQAMDQYGVNTTQMARATGMNYGDVQTRYNKAGSSITPDPVRPTTPTPTPDRKTTTPTPYTTLRKPVDETGRPQTATTRFTPTRPTPNFSPMSSTSPSPTAPAPMKKGGYVSKGGKVNLGSGRVSTASTGKKNPNF